MNGKPIGAPKKPPKKELPTEEIADHKRKKALERTREFLATSQPAESTEWTVMGYLAGDNNLQEEMVLTLQGLVSAAESESVPGEFWGRVKILSQLDPTSLGIPTQRYVFNTTDKPDDEKRYVETYRQDPGLPADEGGYSLDETNTGNPEALRDFVDWSTQFNSGKNGSWALILSGHGSGSTENFLMKDDNPVDALSIPELEEALDEITTNLGSGGQKKQLDLLGMDCCFMSMVEVCYQIREHVKHMVGSESFVPDFGWPYSRILDRAEQLRWDVHRDPVTGQITEEHGVVTPEELAEIMVEQYIDFYSDYDRTAGRSVDIAWIQLADIDGMKTAIDLLGSKLDAALGDSDVAEPEFQHRICAEQIALAHWEAQTYKFDQFVDIRDLCSRLQIRFDQLRAHLEELKLAGVDGDLGLQIQGAIDLATNIAGNGTGESGACEGVIEAFDLCVQLCGCSGFAYQHSYGLAIYFPWACVSDSYRNLEFAKATPGDDAAVDNEGDWMTFLRKYVAVTRRSTRVDGVDGFVTMNEVTAAIEPSPAANLEEALEDEIKGWSAQKKQTAAKGQLKHLLGMSGLGSAGFSGGSRYNRSRYNRSRYNRSRYNRSRWPGDREKSVKNFTPVIGTAYWADRPDVFDW